jgi:hypothetical protein
MKNNLLLEGLSDAVGFVGGALLGFWAGRLLGLDIFARWLRQCQHVAALCWWAWVVDWACSWPVAGAHAGSEEQGLRISHGIC